MVQHPGTPQFGERAEYGPDDVCYRHPNTHTFTLCQRCGRSICNQCQISSSVGVLCPECVKATQPSYSQKTQRALRARQRSITHPQNTVVTYSIMIACAVVFGAQMLVSGVTEALWYSPVYSLPGNFEPWRMLTAMFTHSTSSFFHILFNMYALWLFGRELEKFAGRANFLLLFVLSGLGGSIAVLLWGYSGLDAIRTATVGASGAIFGVLAAMLVAMRAANVNVRSLAILIAINLGIGFLPGVNISWQAHLGGMIVGAVTMGILLKFRGPRQKRARWLALSGLIVILLALSGAYFMINPLIGMLG